MHHAKGGLSGLIVALSLAACTTATLVSPCSSAAAHYNNLAKLSDDWYFGAFSVQLFLRTGKPRNDVRQSQGDLTAGLWRNISLADLATPCLRTIHWQRQHMDRT